MHQVLIPQDKEGREGIPKGAALLAVGRGRAICYYEHDSSFADRCQAAARGQGRIVVLDFPTATVGSYDDADGELRLNAYRGAPLLSAWCGHPIHRGDLEARDNRSTRRAQARRLTMQGRTAEAFRLDRRMGF